MLLAEQTVPDTETIATLIRNAINNANPLSIRKYRHASCDITRQGKHKHFDALAKSNCFGK